MSFIDDHFSMLKSDGWTQTLKHNATRANPFRAGLEPAARGMAFLHASAGVGAVVGLADAAFRSKTSDGEDRSGAMRVIEAVGALTLGTVAALRAPALLAK